MSAQRDRIFRRLAGLRAHAERGTGEEKRSAQEMLDKLMARHGISREDIDSVETQLGVGWYRFTYNSRETKALLIQIAGSRISPYLMVVQGRGSFLWLGLTSVQYVRLVALHQQYMKAYRAEQKKLVVAFINKHDLLIAEAEKAVKPPSEQEIEAILKMISGISVVQEEIPSDRRLEGIPANP